MKEKDYLNSFIPGRIQELEAAADKLFCRILVKAEDGFQEEELNSDGLCYLGALKKLLGQNCIQNLSETSYFNCSESKNTSPSVYAALRESLVEVKQGYERQISSGVIQREFLLAMELYAQCKVALLLYGSLMQHLMVNTTKLATEIRYWRFRQSNSLFLGFLFLAELPFEYYRAIKVALHMPKSIVNRDAATTGGSRWPRLGLSDLLALVQPIGKLPKNYFYKFVSKRPSLVDTITRSTRMQLRWRQHRLKQVRNYYAGALGILAIRYGSSGSSLFTSEPGTLSAQPSDSSFFTLGQASGDLTGVLSDSQSPFDEDAFREKLEMFISHMTLIAGRIEQSVVVLNTRKHSAILHMASSFRLWWQSATSCKSTEQYTPPGDQETSGEQIEDLLDVESISQIRPGMMASGNPYERLLRLMELDSTISKHTKNVISLYGRPSTLVRYWIPGTLGTLGLYALARYSVSNYKYFRQLAVNARETLREFVVDWVWGPMVRVYKTIRHEDNLSVIGASSLESDLESLEHMVVQFAKDQGNFSDDEISSINERTRAGDLGVVLRAYESEIKSPFKSAIRGELVRLLLIQVQKAKVDLELSLTAMDKLLKSNELNFAFLAVIPTLMISVGAYQSIKQMIMHRRGLGQSHSTKDIMRILEHVDRIMTRYMSAEVLHPQAYGHLLCEIADLRVLVQRTRSAAHGNGTFKDLRFLETPSNTIAQKLRVLDRLFLQFSLTLSR